MNKLVFLAVVLWSGLAVISCSSPSGSFSRPIRTYDGAQLPKEAVALLVEKAETSVFIRAIDQREITGRNVADSPRQTVFELLPGPHAVEVVFHSRFASSQAVTLTFNAQAGRAYALAGGAYQTPVRELTWRAEIVEQPDAPEK